MPNVEVQKVKDGQKESVPFFQEFERRFDEIRSRAFKLFENRGRRSGQDLDDWLKAEREVFASPAAELTDKGNAYELQMELPGFEPKDVEVTATSDELIIHAAAREEKKSDKGDVIWSEFSSSDVYRRIPAPTPLNTDGVTATLDKGVLRITAQKTAESKVKSIAVKAA